MSRLVRGDSMVNKDNTSKLANMWETKIVSNEEKGVRKSKAVDTPDEIVVVKPALTSTSSTDSSPTTVTVLKSTSKPLPPLNPTSSSNNLSPNSSTRGIVQSFEKRASENTHEKPLAPSTPTLGTGLRPLKSDASTKGFGAAAVLSRRASSVANSINNDNSASVDELHRKIESMNLRILELERQVTQLNNKVDI